MSLTKLSTELIKHKSDLTNSVERTLKDKFGDIINVKDFGAKGDGVTDDTAAIQAAINTSNLAGGGLVIIPDGNYSFSQITPKSNVTLDGTGTLLQTQVSTSQAGISKAAGAGSLLNFHIRNLKFDGRRVANPGYQYNAIISIELGSGETLNGFTVTNCSMQDAQDHFIRFIATDVSASGSNISVTRCKFITNPDKRSLGGVSGVVSMDAVRFEQTWDYSSAGNGYSTVNFRYININDNTAESIRTLADIKRGCAHFLIRGNHTKNMYDCHHSVDGSFDGIISDNLCVVESSYTGPGTFTDFIEVQGERINIGHNVCNGGGKVVSGVFVTDYGRTQESGIGHPSIGVRIYDNIVKNITTNAFRILNGINCESINNYGENIGAHIATIESGTGRTDGTIPLGASGCTITGNRSKNASLGVKIQGVNHVKGINPDENGQDYLYCPGFADASVYGNFVNSGGYVNLNPNPWLDIDSTTNKLKYFVDPAVTTTVAATKPLGAPQAVTINDDTTSNIRQHTINSFIPVTVGSRLFVKLSIKKNTATSFAVIVQEYDSSGTFISNSFYGTTNIPTSWGEFLVAHKAASANVAHLRVGLIPAASSNDATTSGTTDVANLRISRTAIGI
jgi:hypothetical protein